MLSIVTPCRCCLTLTRSNRIRLAHDPRLLSTTSPHFEQAKRPKQLPLKNRSIPPTSSTLKPKIVPAPRDWSLPPSASSKPSPSPPPARDWSLPPSSAPKPAQAPPPARDWSVPAPSEPVAPGRRSAWGDRGGSRNEGGGPSSGNVRRSPTRETYAAGQDYGARPRPAFGGGGGGGGLGGTGGYGGERRFNDRSQPPAQGFGLGSSRGTQSETASRRQGEMGGPSRFGGKPRDDRFGPGRRDLGDGTPFGNRKTSQEPLFNAFGKESEDVKPPPGSSSMDDLEGGYDVDEGESTQIYKRGGREGGPSRSIRGLLSSADDGEEIVLNRDRRGGRKDTYATEGGKKGAKGHGQEDVKPSRKKKEKRIIVQQAAEKEVFIPSNVSTARLSSIFGVKIYKLQVRMQRLGLGEDMQRPDYLLSAEQACDLAIEFGFNPVIDDELAFDILPEPELEGETYPLRPPVVTIMGHVDHGKTTLLDALRHTSVAAGEAGGITQHIGAFSVPLSSLGPSSSTAPPTDASITFIDTPGHAAFTAMRARGASVTDIVVLVVAADDGVMPQTREVLELVKSEGDKVGLVVAINKVDKPGVDVSKVKSALGAEGILLEEDGGDTPSVRVSGLARLGLDELVETLSTLAEIRDLRARSSGKAEGYVLESNVDRGRGTVATVLITRGTLRTGDSIVAGHVFCRVRQMLNDKGEEISSAGPGTPISMSGWRDLPTAGDQLLQSPKGEEEAKRAVHNRIREAEKRKVMADVEVINVKRKEERLAHEQRVDELKAIKDAGGNVYLAKQEAGRRDKENANSGIKELRLVIKGDVSGTVEAVVGALEGIGNREAKVHIIHTGVGEVNESDVLHAEASEAIVIGFNVPATKAVQSQAAALGIDLHLESVIYRLIETVRAKTAALLPPRIESRTNGEATVLQLFPINLKKGQTMTVAGCRCANGVLKKTDPVRILRGPDRTQVYEGTIESLKHHKKEVTEIRKGMECGIAFKDYGDIQEGDEIVCFTSFEVAREL